MPTLEKPLSFRSLTIIDIREEDSDIHVHVQGPEPDFCSNCRVTGKLVRFGKTVTKYRDLAMRGKRVTLWAERRRYRCNSCMSTFRPILEDMDESRMMTKRLKDYIEKSAAYRRKSEIAKEQGIDRKTVRLVSTASSRRRSVTSS